ncbi:hypothetical protein ACAG96_04480 [Candidatus Izemoplasma sp. B36]|uniref:hypothetical protein n=1 Tax=Candidatus Izemoplasma sp. B36 TaxID=3242468 RepID=UPI003558F90E
MINLNVNEAYLLGLLLGKGEIIEYKEYFEMNFNIKFRKPHTKAKRKDNKYQITKAGITQSIESQLLYDFGTISDTLEKEWNIRSNLIIERTAQDIWNKKTVKLHSDRISKKHKRLCEIFNVDVITSEVLYHDLEYLKIEEDVQRSLGFIQGICDSCSLPPTVASSSYGSKGKPRIQLEPNQDRWLLQVYLCRVFQLGLSVPVNNINYGHPQIRHSWKHQNHQFRINLESIPRHFDIYRLKFKQDFYNELYFIKGINYLDNFNEVKCPLKKAVSKDEIIRVFKSNNRDLNSKLLHENIRGYSVDISRKKSVIICYLLGCKQCRDYFSVIKED